ncbi:MAG: hypothetical protein QM786_18135 [Breznakibacter sp.]
MIEKQDCRQIGVAIKTHGIEGEIVIRLQNNIEIDDLEPEFLFPELDGGLVPFYVESMRHRGDGSVLVGFGTINDEVKAKRLVDAPIWAAWADIRPDLLEDGSIHSTSLIGYRIEDDLHGPLGIVTELRDPERNPLFVVEGPMGEILIPVADEFFTGVDEVQKILYISAPNGLIDLNRE